MEEKSKKYRRTHFVVNKRFQLKYVTLLLSLTVVLCLGFAFASQYLVDIDVRKIATEEKLSGSDIESIIKEEKRAVVGNLMKVFFVVALLMMVLGTYITHKMAGPLFALQRRMKEVVHGDFKATLFKVREGDEFQDLIEAYNEMIFALDNKFNAREKEIKRFVAVLSDTIFKLECHSNKEEIVKNLKNTIRDFKAYIPSEEEQFKKAA